jgi:cobyrinic acid a,c-diamide synthase
MEKNIKILDSKRNVYLYTIEGVEHPSIFTMLVTAEMIRDVNEQFLGSYVVQASLKQVRSAIAAYHSVNGNEMPLNKLFELASDKKHAPIVNTVWEARKKMANKFAVIPSHHSFIFLYQ